MASRAVLCATLGRFRQILSPPYLNTGGNMMQLCKTIQTETGVLPPYPETTRFGLIKVAAVVIPVVTFGGYLSMEFAAWLEDTELFVPDDDDDD